MSDGPRRAPSSLDLERVVFFSDAVFAIAITLLAVDLRLPEGNYTNESLVDEIAAMGPEVAAFALSFGVIALFWVGHFRTFRITDRLDGRLVTLNLVFLGFVALLPFPTSVLAHEGDLAAAAMFYAGYVLVTALLSAALIVYVVRAGLASPAITPAIGRRIGIRALTVPAVFAVSLPIALVSPTAAELLWFLSIPLQIVVTRRLHVGDPLSPGAA